MDYEKLYKEALDNLNRIKNESPEWWIEHEKTMQEIFPGFFETDDERIRKALIKLVKKAGEGYENVIDGISIENAISWLEKQGEQKPVNRLKTTAGNWYVCEMEVVNENMTTAFHRGEVYYCPKDGYIDVNGALFEVGTLDVFRLATKEGIPQQKQVWSEADEKMMSGVVEILESWDCSHTALDGASPSIVPNYVSWLMSLRPQNHWKPSDEQMVALKEACDEHWEPDGLDPLYTLYQDLKKLREE